MAILEQPVNNSNPFADQIGDDLAPAGTFAATIIDIRDEFDIQRQKFQSAEMEVVDLTTFLFGFRDAQGYEHRVSSRRMKISGNEKSTLFAFLKSLLGRAPQYGWDYLELRGHQCLLTVEHVQRRDGTGVFAAIAALSPMPAGFGPDGAMPRQAGFGPAGAAPRQTVGGGQRATGGGPEVRPQAADRNAARSEIAPYPTESGKSQSGALRQAQSREAWRSQKAAAEDPIPF